MQPRALCGTRGERKLSGCYMHSLLPWAFLLEGSAYAMMAEYNDQGRDKDRKNV